MIKQLLPILLSQLAVLHALPKELFSVLIAKFMGALTRGNPKSLAPKFGYDPIAMEVTKAIMVFRHQRRQLL